MIPKNIIQQAIVLIWALMPIVCFSGELPLPDEWRMPTPSETMPRQEWRNEGPNRYLAIAADFNGDMIKDKSMLLVRKNGTGVALFAFVSQKDGSMKEYLLEKLSGQDIQTMGVSVAKPGKYKTACGKGYFDCQEGEPEEIILRYPAIDYFKEEGANSFFYWDENRARFKRTWMSD